MRVTVNGEVLEVDEGTVAEFIRGRGLDPRFVIVERNGEALERSRYDSVRVEEGDRIELVRAVAGG